MKEHQILFRTPMVKANLEDRKTQTRRIIKPQPRCSDNHHFFNEAGWKNDPFQPRLGGGFLWCANCGEYLGYNSGMGLRCPYGKPGDILWVRETWQYGSDSLPYIYKAGYPHNIPPYIENVPDISILKWKPSIFMPREACRLFLEVVSVRVERLQDITEEDAKAEGVQFISDEYGYRDYSSFYGIGPIHLTARESFQTLWISINGQKSWDANPWIWVVEFKKK